MKLVLFLASINACFEYAQAIAVSTSAASPIATDAPAHASITARPAKRTDSPVTCTATYDHLVTNGFATAYCTCNNGKTHPLASPTGGSYFPCPTVGPSPKFTQTPQYGFTETFFNGEILECETAVHRGAGGGVTWNQCAGSSAVISAATTPPPQPSWTVRAWNNTSAYVGTLGGSQLSSLITDALSSGCPSTASTWSCAAPTIRIPGIEYKDSNSEPELAEGSLEFIIRDSYFENPKDLDKTVQAVGLLMQRSTVGKAASCQPLKWDTFPGGFRSGTTVEHSVQTCFIPGGGEVLYFDGIKVGGVTAQLTFDTEFVGRDGMDASDEVCAAFEEGVAIATELLTILFPEASIAEHEVARAIDAVCEFEAQVNSVHSAITSAIGQILTIHGHVTSALGVLNGKEAVPHTTDPPHSTVVSSTKQSDRTKTTEPSPTSKVSSAKSSSTSSLSTDAKASAVKNILNALASGQHSLTTHGSSSSSFRA